MTKADIEPMTLGDVLNVLLLAHAALADLEPRERFDAKAREEASRVRRRIAACEEEVRRRRTSAGKKNF